MSKVNNACIFVVFVSVVYEVYYTQATTQEDWNLNEAVSNILSGDNNNAPNNGPESNVLSDLTKKATVEFDKLFHQLEGVLTQLTTSEPVKITKLGPKQFNGDCKCYCLCPQNMVNSKVVGDIKVKMMDLKQRFINIGKTIKDKIHMLTA